MATKQYYATGDFRYGTRMMRAGDGPIAMTGPQARLYTALGKISPTKPSAAKAEEPAPTVETTKKPQLDHDGNGKAGGSRKGAASTRAKGKRKAKK